MHDIVCYTLILPGIEAVRTQLKEIEAAILQKRKRAEIVAQVRSDMNSGNTCWGFRPCRGHFRAATVIGSHRQEGMQRGTERGQQGRLREITPVCTGMANHLSMGAEERERASGVGVCPCAVDE